jgi:hypothetical protein
VRRLIVAFVVTISACVPVPVPVPVHEDCIGSSGCGYQAVASGSQDLTVTGADQAHLVDGRGRCDTFTSSTQYNDQVRHIRVFLLELWAPASAPRYKIEVRIDGYRGAGQESSADNERFRYDPANGGIVRADVYAVPSPEPLATAKSVAFMIDPGETSGSLRLELPDRTVAGAWHCVPRAITTP